MSDQVEALLEAVKYGALRVEQLEAEMREIEQAPRGDQAERHRYEALEGALVALEGADEIGQEA